MRRWVAVIVVWIGLIAALAIASTALWAPAGPRRGADVSDRVERVQRAPYPEPGRGTSLLWITWDTVRADRVSAYGHVLPTTPTFDALASEGLFFEQFVVPQATTLPTHLSMFTGLHPQEHGVIANSRGGRRFVFPDGVVTLAAHLGARGYRTAGFVSSTPLKEGSGVERGFQVWGQSRAREHRGALTVDAALTWLSEVPPDAPFLLWVHLVDPHFPYRVPPGYAQALPSEPDPEGWLQERGVVPQDRILRWLRAYDREIRYTDDQTARLLDALGAAGRHTDTAVVVAGDHGEGLGQHHTREHGGNWHEQLATVLAARIPGVPAERIGALTTAEDLVPTLAPLVDWPDEPALLAPMSGVDVRAGPAERLVFSRRSDRLVQHNDLEDTIWTVTAPTASAVIGEHVVFYDREVDRHQRLPARDDARLAPMIAALDAARARWAVRAATLGAGAQVDLDEGTRADLEALGYVE